MKGDFTRSTFKPEKKYSSVRMQQGRVQLDADWNEQMDISSHRINTGTCDIIGLCGAPLDGGGFKIDIEALDQTKLTISPGRLYVDGVLCENLKDKTVDITGQEDLPDYRLPDEEGVYLAYLDVWQRHVTAIEDPQIRELALGGPDTATRTKTVWQVKLSKKLEKYVQSPQKVDGAIDCQTVDSGWKAIIKKGNGKLAAFTKSDAPSERPCIISPSAGYRRLENQLYRVEIHEGGKTGKATFKWSRDNGSVVFAIDSFDADGNPAKLKVRQLGRDKTLSLKAGDWVEVLDDCTELSENPAGTLAQIIENPDVAGRIVTLNQPVSGYDPARHPRIRRWDQKSKAISVPSGSDSIELEDGIYVQFSGDSFKAGDYWLIPARTATENVMETGKIEWPLDESNNPIYQPPEGIVHHYCLLAVLQQDKSKKWKIISDCRKLFPALTELTNFFYVCGDGQEAMPGEELPGCLQVGVANEKQLAANATVRFQITLGNGTIMSEDGLSKATGNGKDIYIEVPKSGDGIASCRWILDKDTQHQEVEATLYDACHEPINTPPIRFNANLSLAGQVAYKLPDCTASFINRNVVGTALYAREEVSSITCNVVGTNYQYWSKEQYPVIDLFGEKSVPLLANNDPIWQSHVNKLAKLVLDSDENHTLKTGEKLDLGSGYALEAKQIDVDGQKIWLELSKDGQYVDDQILSTDSGDHTWTCELDKIQGEDNVPVLKVHVNQVFQGATDSIAQVDGLWLIDYANARTLKTGDKLGEFTLAKVVNGIDEANPGSLIFYFPTAERLPHCNVAGTSYECDSWPDEQYPVIDLFGENYVPLLASKDPIWKCHTNKLARLLFDSDESYTLKTGEFLNLGEGYTLQAKQVDVDNEKVWLEFSKDGDYIDDEIISAGGDGDRTWTCELDKIQDEDNIPVLKVHVNQVFQGVTDSIARIDGLWLVDYANAMNLKAGDKLGERVLIKIIDGVDASNPGSLLFELPTVKEFLQKMPGWPPVNKAGNVSVKGILDTLLCKLDAGKIPYNPAIKEERWRDINETNDLSTFTKPDTVQDALDDLVTNLDSSDIPYYPQKCGNAELPTVRSLLDISAEDTGEKGPFKVKDILDALLCSLDAAHLPLDRSQNSELCSKLRKSVTAKTVQDALNLLCMEPGSRGCCIVVQDEKRLQEALEKLEDGSTICLLAGEFKIKELRISARNNIVIRGCTPASKLIADISIEECSNVSLENLNISGLIFVNNVVNFSLKKSIISSGLPAAEDRGGFTVRNCEGALIDSNHFKMREKGLLLTSSNLKIQNNTINSDLSHLEERGMVYSMYVGGKNIEITDNLILQRQGTENASERVPALWIGDGADIVISGGALASKIIGDIQIEECSNVSLENLNTSGNVFVDMAGNFSLKRSIISPGFLRVADCEGAFIESNQFEVRENGLEFYGSKNLKIQNNIIDTDLSLFKKEEVLSSIFVEATNDVEITGNTIHQKVGTEDLGVTVEGIRLEKVRDLKIQKNVIDTDLSLLKEKGALTSVGIDIVGAGDMEVAGNLIQMPYGIENIESRATTTGIKLESSGYPVLVSGNRINAVNGPCIRIKSMQELGNFPFNYSGSVSVHGNFFTSIFDLLATSNTVEVISGNRVIFTDNVCDTYSMRYSSIEDPRYTPLNLIHIKGIDTIFSNNHCLLRANPDSSLETAHVRISADFSSIIGNRCDENIRGEYAYSIIASEKSILLGNITTNKINPEPEDLKYLNLQYV